MFNGAYSGTVQIGNTDMDYVSFGTGPKNIVMLPGLGDGLKTVKGMAYAMAITYKKYARHFKVYVFSRKNQLEEGYSTRDMARDQRIAMDQLEITDACVLGVSQGGMIAQYLAVDCPAYVKKLVLAVTLSKPNETVQRVVSNWISMAEANEYRALFADTARKTYSEKYDEKYRLFYPILARISRPKEYSRFIIQAKSCIQHNAHDDLKKISCPVLVIGGDNDRIVGTRAAEEIANQIPGSDLVVYKGLGHGAYVEAKDFDKRVLDFFMAK